MREIQSILAQVGARLRDERKRIDRSQAELGAVGGVNRDSQAAYETGRRSPPSDYLLAVGGAGIDIVYVLTGKRGTERLSPFASEFAGLAPHLSEADQAALLQIARSLAHRPGPSQRLHAPTTQFQGEND